MRSQDHYIFYYFINVINSIEWQQPYNIWECGPNEMADFFSSFKIKRMWCIFIFWLKMKDLMVHCRWGKLEREFKTGLKCRRACAREVRNQMMTSENRRECNELACQSPFTTVIEVNPCIFRPGNMHSKSQWTSKWVRWTRFKGEQTSAVLRYIHMSLHKLKKPMMKRLTQHTVNLKRSQGSKTSWSSFF